MHIIITHKQTIQTHEKKHTDTHTLFTTKTTTKKRIKYLNENAIRAQIYLYNTKNMRFQSSESIWQIDDMCTCFA